MRGINAVRVGVALVGVAVWGYGYRVDDGRVRWVAIGIWAVALMLRFVPQTRMPESKDR